MITVHDLYSLLGLCGSSVLTTATTFILVVICTLDFIFLAEELFNVEINVILFIFFLDLLKLLAKLVPLLSAALSECIATESF